MGRIIAPAIFVLMALALLAGCGVAGNDTGTVPAAGGRRLVLQAACPSHNPGCDLSIGVQEAVRVLQGRASTRFDVSSVSVQADSSGRITVMIPGAPDDATARQLLTATGTFDILNTSQTFLPVGSSVAGKTCTMACQPGEYQIAFTGAQLDPHSIGVRLDPQIREPVVTFAFAGSARSAFGDYTRTNIGQYLTVTLDDVVVESATIQSEIDGSGEITGMSSMDQARNVAAYMQYGQLPVALSVLSDQLVEPNS